VLINEPSWIRRRKNTTPSVTLFQVIQNTPVLFILFMDGRRVLLACRRDAVVEPALGALPRLQGRTARARVNDAECCADCSAPC